MTHGRFSGGQVYSPKALFLLEEWLFGCGGFMRPHPSLRIDRQLIFTGGGRDIFFSFIKTYKLFMILEISPNLYS